MWTEITRPKYQRKGPGYSSDLSDVEWALIEPRLPKRKLLGRPPKTAMRRVVNAWLYLAVYGPDRLSVANAAEGLPADVDGAALFLCLA